MAELYLEEDKVIIEDDKYNIVRLKIEEFDEIAINWIHRLKHKNQIQQRG